MDVIQHKDRLGRVYKIEEIIKNQCINYKYYVYQSNWILREFCYERKGDVFQKVYDRKYYDRGRSLLHEYTYKNGVMHGIQSRLNLDTEVKELWTYYNGVKIKKRKLVLKK